MAVVARPPGTRRPFAARPFLLPLPFRGQWVPVTRQEDTLQTQPLPGPKEAASLRRNPGRLPLARSLGLAGPRDIAYHLGPEPLPSPRSRPHLAQPGRSKEVAHAHTRFWTEPFWKATRFPTNFFERVGFSPRQFSRYWKELF